MHMTWKHWLHRIFLFSYTGRQCWVSSVGDWLCKGVYWWVSAQREVWSGDTPHSLAYVPQGILMEKLSF